MIWLAPLTLLLSIVAGINAISMWTSEENKAVVRMGYAIMIAVQAVAIAVILK